jgi:hypothetical protein
MESVSYMLLCLVKEQTVYVLINVDCDHYFLDSKFHTVLPTAVYFRNSNP